MPLLHFDLIVGRSDEELRSLLNASHEAMVEAFGVPVRDRYQVVNEHDHRMMIAEDTGLGIERTDKVVILRVTTRPRTTAEKQLFFRLLAEKLESECGILPSDIIVSCVVNTDEDWTFGLGRAQFLTGEL